MKELDENQLNNVTGGNGPKYDPNAPNPDYIACVDECIKKNSHGISSPEIDANCRKQCTTKADEKLPVY